jgi:hypothetical protein
MLMNLSEMATVSMAFYGSGASPGGATGFRRFRSRCESAGLRKRRLTQKGLTYPPFIAQLTLHRTIPASEWGAKLRWAVSIVVRIFLGH